MSVRPPAHLAEPTAMEFRGAVGHFLTGIAVVSTPGQQEQAWGMTVNSFSSVSLDPPLVSVCIAKSAASHAAFVKGDGFGVSILGAQQELLARRFSAPIPNKFDNVATFQGRNAVLLEDSVAWFDCALHELVDAGDHTILIGRVESCASSGQPPIGYYQGSFFAMTAELEAAGDRLRRTTAGWLVEHGGRIALTNVDRSGGECWAIPTSPVRRAATTTDALAASAREAIGADVDVTFLYSITDVQEEQTTCLVYRGQVDAVEEPASIPGLVFFEPDQVPWEHVARQSLHTLRRYVSERATDRFGVFLHLGEGKVGLLSQVRDWTHT